MQERIESAGIWMDGIGPWVGTFHSFGLEVLRRYGHRIGLSPDFKLYNNLDCAQLLENNLPRLRLKVLTSLPYPAMYLPDILRQISRAKDELCDPATYKIHAEAMAREADLAEAALLTITGKVRVKDRETVEKMRINAEKALETAFAYAVYEDMMRAEGAVDYADLIYRTVRLLEDFPDVAWELHARYPHVLADEYQDVNRATARMLKLLAGESGDGLWVVGDHRQSIYRFRGASPANVAAFAADYPNGQRIELGVNYRSVAQIADLFGHFASASSLSQDGAVPAWAAQRGFGTSSSVRYAEGSNDTAIIETIAQECKPFSISDASYRDIALLTRTHAQAKRLAAGLAGHGVPVLYLGDIFDHPEIRDLLCLLAVASGDSCAAFVRVGQLPSYGVELDEILKVIAAGNETADDDDPEIEALEKAAFEKIYVALAANEHDGIRLLDSHIKPLRELVDRPARLIQSILFEEIGYARSNQKPEQNDQERLQSRLALHQLLSLAVAFEEKKTPAAPSLNKTRAFLAHIRRMIAAGESPRGVTPDSIAQFDAVRIMTVHAAKGLEFKRVYMPFLGKGQFPTKGRGSMVPEPPGLAGVVDEDAAEAGEEECLFFVALSRARDEIILSRPIAKEKGDGIEHSQLLENVLPWMNLRGVATETWESVATQPCEEFAEQVLPRQRSFSTSELETYMHCPRQYYYRYRLKLPDENSDDAYRKFHHCVKTALHAMYDEHAAGDALELADVLSYFDGLWIEHGPVGHLHEAQLKNGAVEMLTNAHSIGDIPGTLLPAESMTVELDGIKIRVRPDAVFEDPIDGTRILARYKTGKPNDDHREGRLSVYRRAAQDAGIEHRVEVHYLSSGEKTVAEHKPQYEPARLAKYRDAAVRIQRGEFSEKPGEQCKTCGYFAICPK